MQNKWVYVQNKKDIHCTVYITRTDIKRNGELGVGGEMKNEGVGEGREGEEKF
jgi:hypothetical protein